MYNMHGFLIKFKIQQNNIKLFNKKPMLLNKQKLSILNDIEEFNQLDNSDNSNDMENMSNILNLEINVYKQSNHIYFYDAITIESCLALNMLIENLNRKKNISNIYLHINSHGGSVFDVFSSIDTILTSKIPIISIVEGSVASAATLMSIVCKNRYISENSLMLIHQLSTNNLGTYEELKDDFTNNKKIMKTLHKIYEKYTKMKMHQIKRILQRNLWLDATTCIKLGLADAIWKNNVE